jgi:hypothetical protein
MVSVDHHAPAGTVDHLLWQQAQTLLGRHAAPDPHGYCVGCGWQWPCAPRRLAERAEEASRSPWREALSFRHDLNSVRALPGMRVDGDNEVAGRASGGAGGNRPPRHASVNHRYVG